MSRSRRTPRYLRLRDLLAAAREQAGLTQTELATKLGRPQSFVAKYEGGERRLDVVEFLEVTTALAADPVAILRAVHRTRDTPP